MNENDELEKENDDFESSQVTDGENFTADEKQDQEATNETVPNNLTISECGEQPNDEQQHEDSYDFGFYEEFLKDFADEHNLTYTRDEENPDFKISLKADENTTHIQIDHGRNLTMTAKDNNNETVVPDQQMFDAIAELAHKQGNSITFGNIETPEYAARLYLACKTHQPPIEMIRAPEMNDEFLGKLDQETKKQIEMLVVAQQETENLQNQPADEITTANQEEDHVAEYVQEEEEVKEDSKNSFAAEIQERANVVQGKLKQNQSQEQDSLNKEQNNPDNEKAQDPTKKNILQYYQKNHVH